MASNFTKLDSVFGSAPKIIIIIGPQLSPHKHGIGTTLAKRAWPCLRERENLTKEKERENHSRLRITTRIESDSLTIFEKPKVVSGLPALRNLCESGKHPKTTKVVTNAVC